MDEIKTDKYTTISHENQEGFYPMSEDEYCALVHFSNDEEWWKKMKIKNYKDGNLIYSSHTDHVRKIIEDKLKTLNTKITVEVSLMQPLTTENLKMVERELPENVDIYLTFDQKILKVKAESYETAQEAKYKIEVKLGIIKHTGGRKGRRFASNEEIDLSSDKEKTESEFSSSLRDWNRRRNNVGLGPASQGKASETWNPPSRAKHFGKTLKNVREKTESCCICMDELRIPKKLGCGHIFCKKCIEDVFKHKPACPSCDVVYGIVHGNQPKDGKMWRNEHNYPDLAGYKGFGHIMITYTFPDGVQGPEHPNRGKHYKGMTRSAYLPNNTKGRLVADLLELAFKRRLVFTIGNSRTTGEEGVVIWNGIHHKTSMEGGPQRFGYPDATYLDIILEELASKGITEGELTDSK